MCSYNLKWKILPSGTAWSSGSVSAGLGFSVSLDSAFFCVGFPLRQVLFVWWFPSSSVLTLHVSKSGRKIIFSSPRSLSKNPRPDSHWPKLRNTCLSLSQSLWPRRRDDLISQIKPQTGGGVNTTQTTLAEAMGRAVTLKENWDGCQRDRQMKKKSKDFHWSRLAFREKAKTMRTPGTGDGAGERWPGGVPNHLWFIQENMWMILIPKNKPDFSVSCIGT